MAINRTSAIVPPLGDLCTVRIDPHWPYRESWASREKGGNPIGDKLSFAFVDLENGISDGAQPNYAATEVVGRAEPYQTFVGTGSREIQLTFKFQVQGLPQNVAGAAALEVGAALGGAFAPGLGGLLVASAQIAGRVGVIEQEVVNPALWLESLKHPFVADDGLSHAPPPVYLTVGRLIPVARCIVTQASLQWMPPFDPDTLMPFAAEVQVTFTVVRTTVENTLFRHRRIWK